MQKFFLKLLRIAANQEMLPRPFFRVATRCFALNPALLHVRAMSSSTLDKTIFTPALYQKIQDVWLGGVDPTGEEFSPDVAKRWFMGTPDERLTFDKTCTDLFLPALEAIGPAKLTTPTAEPFLDQLTEIAQKDVKGDGSAAATTALSMVLLLDQMPRNIFRTNEGLIKVYTHYDKISQAFIRTLFSSASPIPRPDLHPQWRNSTAHRMWFHMVLCHSEDIKAHEQLDSLIEDLQQDLDKQPGCAGSKHLYEGHVKSEKEHRMIIDKFGRYPHRNGALGRKSTEEELEFMRAGGATFGVAQAKDEL